MIRAIIPPLVLVGFESLSGGFIRSVVEAERGEALDFCRWKGDPKHPEPVVVDPRERGRCLRVNRGGASIVSVSLSLIRPPHPSQTLILALPTTLSFTLIPTLIAPGAQI